MKNLYFISIFLFAIFTAQGQNVLHYDFTNSLSELNGNGPDLTVLGTVGVYEEDTLGEIGSAKKWVYRFEKNSGFQFDNTAASNFLGDNYTIEIYFVFDELNSWKRVVDWKNRKSDNGAYVFNGELNFYPYIYSDEAPVVAGEYTYYVITRDAESKELLIYTDAKVEIGFVDNSGDALLDEENLLNFFHDDLVVADEASPGAVAMLKLYNYTLDSATIKSNFDDLAGGIFFIGERGKINTNIRTFPNPVRDHFIVDLGNFESNESVNIRLINTSGSTVLNYKTIAGSQQKIMLNEDAIQNGLYFLLVESESKTATGKVLIQR